MNSDKYKKLFLTEADEKFPETVFCLKSNMRRRVIQAFFQVAECWSKQEFPDWHASR